MKPLLKMICKVPECGKTFGSGSTRAKICPECKKQFIMMLERNDRKITPDNIAYELTQFFRSRMTIVDYEKKHITGKKILPDQEPLQSESGKTLVRRTCQVKNCTKTYYGAPVSKMCVDCRSRLIKILHDHGRSGTKDALKEAIKYVFKHRVTISEYEQIIEQRIKNQSNHHEEKTIAIPVDTTKFGFEPDDPQVTSLLKPGEFIVSKTKHAPSKETDIARDKSNIEDHVVDAMVIPLMRAIKAGNDFMVRSGFFPSGGKGFDAEKFRADLIAEIKQEVMMQFDTFKRNFDNKALCDAAIASMKMMIHDLVVKEVAMRFKFMTNAYEDHLKNLEIEDKNEKKKEMLFRDF